MNKKILFLGAGMVVKPGVRYIEEKTNYNYIIASRTKSKIDKLLEGKKRGEGVEVKAEEIDKIDKLIKNADLVISFLPYVYHIEVAKLCLKHKKPLITTSYVKEDMAKLNEHAKKEGVIFLNEIGLDPGIDHLTATKLIDEIHERKGKIKEFYSYCGALPSPEHADNPFKYKFSWSPEGVVRAGNNPGRYLKNKKIIEIPANKLFEHYWEEKIENIGKLEIYPNRDSLIYKNKYHIPEIETLIRGTFRYPGWCKTMNFFSKKSFTCEQEKIPKNIKTWKQLLLYKLNLKEEEIERNIESEIYEKIKWLGLLEERPLPEPEGTVFQNFVKLLEEKLKYEEGEKDMVVLKTKIVAEIDGKMEIKKILLIDYGEIGKETAVARTVSLPAVISAKLILEGKITLKGVWIPNHKEIYEPVLKELEEEGIKIHYALEN